MTSTEREELAEWDDPQTQVVYRLLTDPDANNGPEEHWEGWVARRIVAALRTPSNTRGDALKAMTHFAADERDWTILLTGLLGRAREYVVDALDAMEHSDGRELLAKIDAALNPTNPIPGQSGEASE